MSDTRKLTKMALLVALTCVSAYISFPIPFSPAMVTATTLVLCLIGFLLPPKEALLLFVCIYYWALSGCRYFPAVPAVLVKS